MTFQQLPEGGEGAREDELHGDGRESESCLRQEHDRLLEAQQGQGRAPGLGTANDPGEGCRDTDGLYSATFCT